MAKTQSNKITIEEAQDKYKTACAEYEKEIKQSFAGLSDEQIKMRIHKCRVALAEKRYAAAVLDAVKGNKPMLKREDVIEANVKMD